MVFYRGLYRGSTTDERHGRMMHRMFRIVFWICTQKLRWKSGNAGLVDDVFSSGWVFGMIEISGLQELKICQNVFGAQTQSVPVPDRKYVGKWAQPISEICLGYWVVLRRLFRRVFFDRVTIELQVCDSLLASVMAKFRYFLPESARSNGKLVSIKHPFAINQQQTNTWKHPVVMFSFQ